MYRIQSHTIRFKTKKIVNSRRRKLQKKFCDKGAAILAAAATVEQLNAFHYSFADCCVANALTRITHKKSTIFEYKYKHKHTNEYEHAQTHTDTDILYIYCERANSHTTMGHATML